MSAIVHVVAGIVFNERGEFLLSSRPEGKPYAGYWEFAGGKVEQGETEFAALQREFAEELGITIMAASPWLTKFYEYEHARVHLRFFRVAANAWQGDLCAREGQNWAWQQAGQCTVSPMLPANTALLHALSFPQEWSGSLHDGLCGYSPMGEWRLTHAIQGERDAENVWLHVSEIQELGDLPDGKNSIWLAVSSQQTVQAACNMAVDGVIWLARDEQTAQAACTVLEKGCALPVLVSCDMNLLAKWREIWLAMGAQGVVALM